MSLISYKLVSYKIKYIYISTKKGNKYYSEGKIMFRVGDLVTWNLKEALWEREGERGVVLSAEEGVSWKICLVRWSCGTECNLGFAHTSSRSKCKAKARIQRF